MLLKIPDNRTPVSDSRTPLRMNMKIIFKQIFEYYFRVVEFYCLALEFYCRIFLIRSSTVAYIEIIKIYLKYWGSIVGRVLSSVSNPFLSFEFWTCQIDGVKECCVRYRLVFKSSATAILFENYQRNRW
jgi:hypothetical protein